MAIVCCYRYAQLTVVVGSGASVWERSLVVLCSLLVEASHVVELLYVAKLLIFGCWHQGNHPSVFGLRPMLGLCVGCSAPGMSSSQSAETSRAMEILRRLRDCRPVRSWFGLTSRRSVVKLTSDLAARSVRVVPRSWIA